jgi:DNA helicase II / ATP-dependent DNA helicase PcrA
VKGILTFQNRYPSVKQIKLEENFRSSKGIVETAREFIEKNPDRLPKKMQPTDAQDYEEGDIVALSFDTPELEAQHIVQSIKTLHGVAVKEPTDKDPHHKRGLAYSDMAVLFRSVDKNAEAVSRAFDQAHIPYIIVGMNNLFTTAEAEAARQLFYFMDALPAVATKSLEDTWMSANIGLKRTAVHNAVAEAQALRDEFRADNLRNVR